MKSYMICKGKQGIAMIELIFSIVIMGLVILTAPLLLSTATNSGTVTFQQESIAIIASHANAVMSHAWDEENTISQDHMRILDTESTTTALERNVTIIANSMLRKNIHEANASAIATFGKKDKESNGVDDELSVNDVDDFEKTNIVLELDETDTAITDEGGYIDKNISISTTVTYGSDTPSSPTFATCASSNGCAFSNPFSSASESDTSTNVKRVVSELTSSNIAIADKKIVLKFFMCNIGSSARPRQRAGY